MSKYYYYYGPGKDAPEYIRQEMIDAETHITQKKADMLAKQARTLMRKFANPDAVVELAVKIIETMTAAGIRNLEHTDTDTGCEDTHITTWVQALYTDYGGGPFVKFSGKLTLKINGVEFAVEAYLPHCPIKWSKPSEFMNVNQYMRIPDEYWDTAQADIDFPHLAMYGSRPA